MIFTHADLDAYATASRDTNPIHLDDAAAQSVGFKRRIAHGMMVIETILQRPENPRIDNFWALFKSPVYPDETYEIETDSHLRRIVAFPESRTAAKNIVLRWNVENLTFNDSRTHSQFSPMIDCRQSGFWRTTVLRECSHFIGSIVPGDKAILIGARIRFDNVDIGVDPLRVRFGFMENRSGWTDKYDCDLKFFSGDTMCAEANLEAFKYVRQAD